MIHDPSAPLHRRAASALEAVGDAWLIGLLARFVFAAVLLGYYWNSAVTKLGEGVGGIFAFSDGAYMQILPSMMEASGYDSSAIPFFPWWFVVAAGTWAEFVLPALILVGLLTRLSALGMIGFIVVQSWVDVAFHGVDATTVGALFDRASGSAILDQRLLWVFVLAVLVLKGAGALSLDALLFGRRADRAEAASVGIP